MAGLASDAATIVIGLIDASILGLWGQLVMLGIIGWNLPLASGTAPLPNAYQEGGRYRAQGLSDSVRFSTQAVASLSAGRVISTLNWQALLIVYLLPIAAIGILLILQRRAPA